jgi:ribonuclease HII
MEKPIILRAKQVKSIRKNSFEKRYWTQGQLVCGIDEAGRGPLAGPVVAAAVILPIGTARRGIKDSKLMTPEEREKAFTWIINNAYYGIGMSSAATIDIHNIYYATLMAMQRAICQLYTIAPTRPAAMLVDAMPVTLQTTPYKDTPVHAFVYGESISISVAAASIIAKVVRDRIMVHAEGVLPGYNFMQHKGYATPAHWTAIQHNGASILHRMRFLEILTQHGEPDERLQQQLLWGGTEGNPD